MPSKYPSKTKPRDPRVPKVLSRKDAELKKFKRELKLRHSGAVFGEAFCNFMEKRWEKPGVNPKDIYDKFGKTPPPSSSSKNNRSPEARQRAMDKARTPVRRVKLGEDFPGQATGASGEGNEQGVSGAATSSKTSKGLTLKKPKRPEDVVKPLANEAFCQFMKTYKDKE